MSVPKPIPADVGEFVSYDPETGLFTRTWSKQVRFVGQDAAKQFSRSGYLMVLIPPRRRVLAHRVAWFLHFGIDPIEHVIDHINGDICDNRIANLRLASVRENSYNRKLRVNASGLPTGVMAQRPSGFQARIMFKGVLRLLGTYPTPELAHAAYRHASIELHGEFSAMLRP